MLLDHPRSWFLPSSGNSVFTASSPLAYFRHIFSLSHAASFDSPVHATINRHSASMATTQRWPWTGWFQLRKHETTVNWDCPKTGKEQIFFHQKILEAIWDFLDVKMWSSLKWWPFEQANDDEPTQSMEQNPKPSSLEATCLCPVTAGSWESSTHKGCLFFPQWFTGRKTGWLDTNNTRHVFWCFFTKVLPSFFVIPAARPTPFLVAPMILQTGRCTFTVASISILSEFLYKTGIKR